MRLAKDKDVEQVRKRLASESFDRFVSELRKKFVFGSQEIKYKDSAVTVLEFKGRQSMLGAKAKKASLFGVRSVNGLSKLDAPMPLADLKTPAMTQTEKSGSLG